MGPTHDVEGWEGTGRTDEVGKAFQEGSRVSRGVAMEILVRVLWKYFHPVATSQG